MERVRSGRSLGKEEVRSSVHARRSDPSIGGKYDEPKVDDLKAAFSVCILRNLVGMNIGKAILPEGMASSSSYGVCMCPRPRSSVDPGRPGPSRVEASFCSLGTIFDTLAFNFDANFALDGRFRSAARMLSPALSRAIRSLTCTQEFAASLRTKLPPFSRTASTMDEMIMVFSIFVLAEE